MILDIDPDDLEDIDVNIDCDDCDDNDDDNNDDININIDCDDCDDNDDDNNDHDDVTYVYQPVYTQPALEQTVRRRLIMNQRLAISIILPYNHILPQK